MVQNKAPEKERCIPFSAGLPIFDEATGKYVPRKPAARPVTKRNCSPVKLRDMTPFHKGYDAVHKNKRAKMTISAESKRRISSIDYETEPEYNRSRFLGHGDGKNPPVWNPYTGKYERLSFNEFGAYESQSGSALGARPGNYGVVHGTTEQKGTVRRKNGGLEADNPVVLFPGEPLVVATRKALELEKEFPGMPLDKALAQKKRRIASEKESKDQPAKKRVKASTTVSANPSKAKVDLAAWLQHSKRTSQGRHLQKAGIPSRAQTKSTPGRSAISASKNTTTGLLSPPETP
ncbi:hypothetical protein DTO164E3_221 [Paecilomyces variotii]|uniref:Uncharacterized protein n=1 Tax=Byssochlamys spectabilis TaxID=264951 RepID=A0A443HT60_BYSSP|nr:hypothetical protein C8Q69DRAFT_277905 [Paecilomyces variotii]KAJ9192324.1 hypothetical protein DTO032I3_8384 [Paecilomyces variotii]KAJ9207935.1 hypothetical protein DTO164E3_221 [Paecilomyces variotii]KAJ9227366.1 hypothetical protein DTO169C6_7 [Paecilomyces variotii]KAJ9245966.1 hypothetical protein DTO169E5_90 [Paecilomyces variotii]KAJ9274332.1 hypothetical protein DTO021D3_8803 [Paecilomyces variotii]